MRDPDSGWIRPHVGELFLLWTELGLGSPPAVLDVPPIGRTPAVPAELVRSAGAALAGRGLGTVVEPNRDLAALLRRVADAEVRIDLHAEGPSTAFRPVGALERRTRWHSASRARRCGWGRSARGR
ncbi:EspG family protein [Amycolatopsis arida]|uniref:EspG family protein n=1 Tax=Amycolatopsis arida TaxID=587909 RepID=A0A1I5YG68_9PSEU|nr:ESAT-6 protein secretion system EspG family protein [Amycolatopsis arida]SFQ43173.1 EspG family protein [Amycolatopsis arida]